MPKVAEITRSGLYWHCPECAARVFTPLGEHMNCFYCGYSTPECVHGNVPPYCAACEGEEQ